MTVEKNTVKSYNSAARSEVRCSWKVRIFSNTLTLKLSPSGNSIYNISLNILYLYFQSYILPYLNLSLLILTLVYLPINLVPYPLVWLYDKILWMTEPVLMVAEIILALNFVMHCSQTVIEKMEEDDSNLWKVILMSNLLIY